MAKLSELLRFLDEILDLTAYGNDSSNNGLQVEGNSSVSKAFFAVDSSLSLFRKAAAEGADFVFVHHGISWKDGLRRIKAHDSRMLSALYSGGVSLYAAHLPLDANPEFGHNIMLAKILSLKGIRPFGQYAGYSIGFMGNAPAGSTPKKLAALLSERLGAICSIQGDPDAIVKNCGIVSGGGADCAVDALENNLDCFITGERSHSWHSMIRDSGLNTVFAGHYCTEKPGVMAAMSIVQRRFKIKCEFIDIPTGL